MGATNADFELLKGIVYTHTDTMPKVDEELTAARVAALGAPPPAAAGAAPAGPPRRLRMGNFVPLRVSEAQLRDIYDWSKNEIGFRPPCRRASPRPRPGRQPIIFCSPTPAWPAKA